jgi:hypothetical protein
MIRRNCCSGSLLTLRPLLAPRTLLTLRTSGSPTSSTARELSAHARLDLIHVRDDLAAGSKRAGAPRSVGGSGLLRPRRKLDELTIRR